MVKDTDEDGNCFYHALALALQQLGQHGATHEAVRRSVCGRMLDEPGEIDWKVLRTELELMVEDYGLQEIAGT